MWPKPWRLQAARQTKATTSSLPAVSRPASRDGRICCIRCILIKPESVLQRRGKHFCVPLCFFSSCFVFLRFFSSCFTSFRLLFLHALFAFPLCFLFFFFCRSSYLFLPFCFSSFFHSPYFVFSFVFAFFLLYCFFMPFPSSCLFPSLFLIFLYLFILLASSFSLSFSAFSLLRLLGLPVPSAVFRRLFPLSFFVMKFSLLLIGSILISLP